MQRVNNMLGLQEISMEKVLNFLPYPFLVSEWRDGKQCTLFINKKFEEEIGYPLSSVATIEHWFEKAYPDVTYRNEVSNQWKQLTDIAASKNEVEHLVQLKVKIVTAAQGAQWYELKAFCSGPMQLVAFVNINAEIQKEEILERMNENNKRILSILSHDLRAPLNNLHAIISLSQYNSLTLEHYSQSMKMISAMTMQLLEFMNNTLRWAQSNFDQINVVNHAVVVPRIVNEIVTIFEKSYTEKGIQVNVQIKDEHPIYGDAEIISVVFRNVFFNAIKFTSNGIITISSSRDENYFILSVEDNGVGMTKERVTEVLSGNFNSTSGTQNEKGIGLGLKLCNELIGKIGGKIEIESLQGKGTTVCIYLRYRI